MLKWSLPTCNFRKFWNLVKVIATYVGEIRPIEFSLLTYACLFLIGTGGGSSPPSVSSTVEWAWPGAESGDK